MKISILSPSFNQGKYITEMIESVLKQDYNNYELIVADGGSSDLTVEILKSYSQVKWISEPDEGQSDALNKAFLMSTGDIIGWINTDEEYYSKDIFSSIVKLFSELPERTAVIYGDLFYRDEVGNDLGIIKSHNYNYKKMLRGRFIPLQPTVFIRRSSLLNLGFVSKQFKWSMDFELYARLGSKYDFYYLPKCFGIFHVHSGSKSTGNKGINILNYERENSIIRKTYDDNLFGLCMYKLYRLRSGIAKATKYRKIFN